MRWLTERRDEPWWFRACPQNVSLPAAEFERCGKCRAVYPGELVELLREVDGALVCQECLALPV